MKPLYVRLGLVGLVVALGVGGYALAQHYLGGTADGADASQPDTAAEEQSGEVVADAGSGDPFVMRAAGADSPGQPRRLSPETTAAANPLRAAQASPRSGERYSYPQAKDTPAHPARQVQYLQDPGEVEDSEIPDAGPDEVEINESDNHEDASADEQESDRPVPRLGTPPGQRAPAGDRYPVEDADDRYAQPKGGAQPKSAPQENSAEEPAANGGRIGSGSNAAIPPARALEEPRGLDDRTANLARPATLPGANQSNHDPSGIGGGGAANLGSDRPGGSHLEGPQDPSVSIEKRAPAEVQVGKPAPFEILVHNTGRVAAEDVQVVDVVPQGMRVESTRPQAEQAGERLVWSLGRIAAGEERKIEIQLVPTREGELGSVASLSYRAEASTRTLATKPVLQLEVNAPRQALIGEEVKLAIHLVNSGSGAAKDVILYNALPPQLKHDAGGELEYEVGTLAPGESRDVQLTLRAAAAGQVRNPLIVRADGNVLAEAEAALEVIAPSLEVALEGPRRRYLERQATYVMSVNNPGTAPAKDIELVSHLPSGMKFVSANNAGEYDEAKHAVHWSLAELPQGETGRVTLVTMPTEAGQQRLTIEGTADLNLSDRHEETITVEGLAAIFFEVVDVADPIEVGGQTTYEVRVVNQGTKSAQNVRVAALVPEGLEFQGAEGPVRHTHEGGRLLFDPLPRLAPKADTTFFIKAQGAAAGDQRLRVQVICDAMDQPVTKEESTRVYSDR